MNTQRLFLLLLSPSLLAVLPAMGQTAITEWVPKTAFAIAAHTPPRKPGGKLKSPTLRPPCGALRRASTQACYTLSMTPLDKCMQTLSALVRLDDLDGVDLMEAAVGDLREAAGSDSEVRITALDHLADTVRRQGWKTMFAGLF